VPSVGLEEVFAVFQSARICFKKHI
jgi:hypothetical protein